MKRRRSSSRMRRGIHHERDSIRCEIPINRSNDSTRHVFLMHDVGAENDVKRPTASRGVKFFVVVPIQRFHLYVSPREPLHIPPLFAYVVPRIRHRVWITIRQHDGRPTVPALCRKRHAGHHQPAADFQAQRAIDASAFFPKLSHPIHRLLSTQPPPQTQRRVPNHPRYRLGRLPGQTQPQLQRTSQRASRRSREAPSLRLPSARKPHPARRARATRFKNLRCEFRHDVVVTAADAFHQRVRFTCDAHNVLFVIQNRF